MSTVGPSFFSSTNDSHNFCALTKQNQQMIFYILVSLIFHLINQVAREAGSFDVEAELLSRMNDKLL